MRADNIQNIISNINELPYKAILFDGVWGIGKSYAINEALEDNPNVCKISMFGLKDPSQIYHEVLFQLVLKNNTAGKIAETANNIFSGISKLCSKFGKAKDALQSIYNERDVFFLLAREFTSVHIIVIDDLERTSAGINLEEVFGIVEELKKCSYVKVILVANTGELPEDKKAIFDKYNEKVIERIYHITERSEMVAWSKLNIHAGFIEKFLSIHKVENLRTLEKAQRFFEDVRLYCKEDEQFLDEVWLICFAVVVESTDKLYYKEANPDDTDSMHKTVSDIGNMLEHRLEKYLYGIKCRNNLAKIVLSYYEDGVINKEQLNVEYEVFLKSGDKANYYKSDEEIKRLLPDLRKDMTESSTIIELNQFVDSYIIWSDILEENNESVLLEYRNILNKMLKEAVRDGKEADVSYLYELSHMSSDKTKKIYQEEIESMKKFLIETYVEYLQNTTHGKKAYEYSRKLRNYYGNSSYHDIIVSESKKLYNENSFPISKVDEEQYFTCRNIMDILYRSDGEKFLQYCDALKEKCDNMSRHRIETLLGQIVKK